MNDKRSNYLCQRSNTSVSATTTGDATDQQQAAQPFRYQSKYFHAQSGLVDFGFRFYSPSLGRWINRDPLGESGGVNLYGYVGNDPVNRIDPNGLWGVKFGNGPNIGIGDPSLHFTSGCDSLDAARRGFWTGNGNASDAVYYSAVNGAADWAYNDYAIRGVYYSREIGSRNAGGVKGAEGPINFTTSINAGWTVDTGFSSNLIFGMGVTGGGTKSLSVGYNEDKGWIPGGGYSRAIGPGRVGFWESDPLRGGKPSLLLGASKGQNSAGIIIAPEKAF